MYWSTSVIYSKKDTIPQRRSKRAYSKRIESYWKWLQTTNYKHENLEDWLYFAIMRHKVVNWKIVILPHYTHVLVKVVTKLFRIIHT